jgi:tyrosine-protein kinase Etk/Wzc
MSEQLDSKLQRNGGAAADEEGHLLDVLVVLAQHKKLIIGAPIVTGILAMVVSLFITPIFTSVAKIMPPQQQQSSGMAAMLGQLGGLAGAAGGVVGLKSSNDLYVGLLESRTVADNLIARLKLKERYATKTMDAARDTLAASSLIAAGKKDGFITITVNDRDSLFAADLANAYVDELAKLTQSIALTEASQRRLFFERQLKDARDQLADAEIALRKTQEKTGMIQPEAQVQAIIINAAQVKGAIAAKEVQLNAMRSFAAGQNPDLLRAQEELRGLQIQLAKLEKNHPSKDGDFMVPTGKIPEVGVEYVRSMRNVKYYETIFELLAKQFELAKIDEAKNSSLVQVLDKALPAERRSKPRRVFITLAGAFAGGLLGVVLAFMRAAYIKSRSNAGSRKRWEQVAFAWNRTPIKAERSS